MMKLLLIVVWLLLVGWKLRVVVRFMDGGMSMLDMVIGLWWVMKNLYILFVMVLEWFSVLLMVVVFRFKLVWLEVVGVGGGVLVVFSVDWIVWVRLVVLLWLVMWVY